MEDKDSVSFQRKGQAYLLPRIIKINLLAEGREDMLSTLLKRFRVLKLRALL